ncbi:cobalt-precorrin-5B (C(1))-methyltransferase CbiD [Desulfomarina sp.]
MSKRLRSGFTTGSCAAAAAKAAALMLQGESPPATVEIPFPDGSRKIFQVNSSQANSDGSFEAYIIKDAGDDPDVTNGAEIGARAAPGPAGSKNCVDIDGLLLCGGSGVGMVTKPGLAVRAGEPAINPVPRKMITGAVREAIPEGSVTITIIVPRGEELAVKTLNHRLGVVGGISILGTTGIVRPVSADAWTATIKASMDVAKEAGLKDIVISTGRTSEKGAQQLLDLREEAYAMMGDYLEFSLLEAAKHGFSTIHLSGMWAKIVKAALRVPQTHVRNGALEMVDAARLLEELGADGKLLERIKKSNTAREMYKHLEEAKRREIVTMVCQKAREYGEDVSGRKVKVYLVDHKARILAHV